MAARLPLEPLPTFLSVGGRSPIHTNRRAWLGESGRIRQTCGSAAAAHRLADCRLATGLALSILFGSAHRATFVPRNPRGSCKRTVCAAGSSDESTNVALVFVKPHANTEAVRTLLPEFLKERGIEVLRNGSVDAEEIDSRGIIDSHYAAIAEIGTAKDVSKLGLLDAEASVFEEGYGRKLDEALAAGEVHSAITALQVLDITPTELLSRCLAAGYVKLRSGLYCAKLDGGDGPIFVLNGFYARMREKFVAPGVVVPWYVVSFKPSVLTWSAFRQDVIGATQPSDAVDGSFRATVRDRWQELGLKDETNYQDNGVHASAGPLESLRERKIWAGENPHADAFGAEIERRSTVPLDTLLENPILSVSDDSGRAFDLLEDVDTDAALDKLSSCKSK